MPAEKLSGQMSWSEIHRVAYLKWRDAPPGMSPALADQFMDEIKSGKTIRMLTSGMKKDGPAIVTPGRFKTHCELHPEWAAAAWRFSKMSTRARKISRFRAMTHYKYGHPLADASHYQKDGYIARHCRVCRIIRAKRGGA